MNEVKGTYDKSKYAALTYLDNGEEFDSGLEARFAIVAYQYNFCDVGHNGSRYMFRDLAFGYKPDFRYPLSNTTECWIDVKGSYIDKRTKAIVRACIDNFEDNRKMVKQFVLATAEDIRVYDKDTKNINDYKLGALYFCDACGHGYVSAQDDRHCPYCGKEGEFICIDFNERGNEIYRAESQWEKYCNTTSTKHEKSEREEKLVSRFMQLAKEAGIELQTKRSELNKFFTPYEPNGIFTPDCTYDEKRKDVKNYGTAKTPFAMVLTIDKDFKNYEQRRLLAGQLANILKQKNNSLVKVIVLSKHAGIQVATPKHSKYEPGALYHCDACGSGYVAQINNHACPCCGSSHVHQTNKD